MRGGALFAQSFDPSTFVVGGDLARIIEHVSYAPNIMLGEFSASENGILACGSGNAPKRRIVWRDRTGRELGTVAFGTDKLASSLRDSPRMGNEWPSRHRKEQRWISGSATWKPILPRD